MQQGQLIESPEILEAEQEIHLRDYFRIIRKRKTLVLSIFIIVFLTVLIKTFTTTPVYTASSKVLIEKNIGSSNLESTYYHWDPDFLNTQFEIIKSVKVSQRVVERLQLDTKYRHFFLDKQPDDSPSILGSIKKTIKGLLGSEKESSVTESKSPLQVVTEPLTDAEIIAGMIRGSLSTSPVRDTKIVLISYSDQHPAMAKMIADEVVQAYMDVVLEIKLESSQYSLQWMTAKAEEERKKLEDSERALQKYMRENDLVTVEDKLTVYPQRLSEFSSQLSKAQTTQKEYEVLNAQIKRLGKDYRNIETIPVFADNAVLKTLREKIYTSDQKIKELSKKYGYKHPVMVKAKEEQNLLLQEKRFEVERIIKSTKNSYETAKAKEENLTKLLSKTKAELLNTNERFMQYSIMKRETEMTQVLYDALTTNIKKTSVTEQTQDVKIWVVKGADLPGGPSKPNKKRNLALGLILGLAGGIGLAFFIEYLDNTVKSPEELEQKFGLSVLGSVELLKGDQGNIETYVLENPLSPLAESYRLIKSSLLLSNPEKPPQTILITSMAPQEGKTSTTSNLARILAKGDKKVIIIDCDMRRPRMHSLFNMPNSYGLSNYLSGNAKEAIVQQVRDEGVVLIPSGPIPPNPAELLHSKKMEVLVDEMRKRYDFVLLDSPPVQSVTDSLTLSTLVDGTLVVVRAGKTTYDSLQSGLKKMYETNVHILGLVLNGVTRSGRGGTYGYGYYDYYSSNEPGKGVKERIKKGIG